MRYVDLTSGNVVNLPEKVFPLATIGGYPGFEIRNDIDFCPYDYDEDARIEVLNQSKIPNYLEPLD